GQQWHIRLRGSAGRPTVGLHAGGATRPGPVDLRSRHHDDRSARLPGDDHLPGVHPDQEVDGMTSSQGNNTGGDPGRWQAPQQGQHTPGQGDPAQAYPGQATPGYAGYPPQGPGTGARVIAFLTRDIGALVAAAVTLVSGLILLATPSLAWIRDSSSSLVDGTMSVSARGTVSLSSLAERALSESDALELGFTEMGIQTVMGPFAAMLMLSALLVLVGGLLMLTTARQLGATVALMGVIPQLLVVAVVLLTAAVFSDSSGPTPQPGPSPDSGLGAGAGFYATTVVYVLVIICAAVAARHPERGRRPAPYPQAGGPQSAPCG